MAYKLERMGLGGILDQALAIIKDHFRLLFTIMLLTVIPLGVIQQLLLLGITPELPANPRVGDVREVQIDGANVATTVVFALFTIINGLVVTPIANAAVIQSVARLYLGQEISATTALRHGLRRLLPLLGTTILVGLMCLLGFIMCVIPYFVFIVWYSLAQHVVVIEELSGWEAMKRSKQLVMSDWVTLVVMYLILMVIGFGVYAIAAFVPSQYLQVVVSPIVQAVATVISTAALVVYYFSCRCAVDNFDLEYLAHTIESEPAV